jgi:hypothetical protein
MDDTLEINVTTIDCEFSNCVVHVPNTFIALDLINLLIGKYSLPTTHYVYSLYIIEELDFLSHSELDYIYPNEYLNDYAFSSNLNIVLKQEYRSIFNIKQMLRKCNLM